MRVGRAGADPTRPASQRRARPRVGGILYYCIILYYIVLYPIMIGEACTDPKVSDDVTSYIIPKGMIYGI